MNGKLPDLETVETQTSRFSKQFLITLATAVAVIACLSVSFNLPHGSQIPGVLWNAIIAPTFYFLPTIIAIARKRQTTLALFVLNLVLGWTVIGWIVALIWALYHERDSQRYEPHVARPPTPSSE